jgi:hypothetical protein
VPLYKTNHKMTQPIVKGEYHRYRVRLCPPAVKHLTLRLHSTILSNEAMMPDWETCKPTPVPTA